MIKGKVFQPKKIKAESKPVKQEYVDLTEPVVMDIDETSSFKITCSKLGQDGEPHLDVRTWIETERYSGPTKKGINFPVYHIQEMIDTLVAFRDVLVEIGELQIEEE